MKVDVYNQKGEKIGTTLLPKDVFGVSLSPDLIYQAALSLMANQRKATAHAKDRSEVRGGGRKPWRQKGTGRARHGSRRSPIWKGGGVTFGPTKDRVFKKKINRKMKRKALLMVLSAKAKDNLLILLDKIKLDKAKTREISEIFKKLPCKEKKSLLILPAMDKNIIIAARNIPEIKAVQAKDLNLLDLLSFKCLVMPKEAIKIIKETFTKQPLEDDQEDLSASVPEKTGKPRAATS
jgi:large subunit ribosomal protein L4